MSRRDVLFLALLLPVLCTGAAIVILLLAGIELKGIFRGSPLAAQVAWGLIVGVGAGALANAIEFNAQWFRTMREIARQAFARIRPTRLDLVLISAGAGWGEELLFRGALQPIFGIWITAAAFALAHGLMLRLSWGRIAYTAVLFFAGAGLGYLARWQGLAAAMIAHGAYDLVVLAWAQHLFSREQEARNTE